VDSVNRTVYPAFCPDADSVAFTYNTLSTSANDINTIALLNGNRRSLTTTGGTGLKDRYPTWAADGRTVMFDREIATDGYLRRLYKVPIVGNPVAFFSPSALSAKTPFYSPDAKIVVTGLGDNTNLWTVATLESAKPASTVMAVRSNYPDYKDGSTFPIVSPDGTRLAMAARDPRIAGAVNAQVFASRRNMNLPPQVTTVGTTAVVDSSTVANFCVQQGGNYFFTIVAVDPEGDALTYDAFFMQPWMSFDQTLRRLTVAPGGVTGKAYNVVLQVTTASGGTDRIIARFTVGCSGPGFAGKAVEEGEIQAARGVEGPNPTSGEFAAWTPKAAGVTALAGRVRSDRTPGRSRSPAVRITARVAWKRRGW